jgi:hypothetical protein
MRCVAAAILLSFAVVGPFQSDVLGAGLLLRLGPRESVKADGVEIQVPGHSAPSFVHWDNDGLKDLVIGEGGAGHPAKVRVYLNLGTEDEPAFGDFFYVQSRAKDVQWAGSAQMGCVPRIVYWDADGNKDLLVGLANGTAKVLVNAGSESEPVFEGEIGLLAQYDTAELDVGEQAVPAYVDWDNDTRMDIVVGGLDGKIHIYLNCGCGGGVPPSFYTSPAGGAFAQQDAADLVVPSLSSSPLVLDLDRDGRKDLLAGNTEGQLLFYSNVATDPEPAFSGYQLVRSEGKPIDLAGSAYSRPSVCYWTGDGHFGPADVYPDVLIGAADGRVHLYRGVPTVGDINLDGGVNVKDFALFAGHWQQRECWPCGGADLTGDGAVDCRDLTALAQNWLDAVE